jgi:hypothetical protein
LVEFQLQQGSHAHSPNSPDYFRFDFFLKIGITPNEARQARHLVIQISPNVFVTGANLQ